MTNLIPFRRKTQLFREKPAKNRITLTKNAIQRAQACFVRRGWQCPGSVGRACACPAGVAA